ncbi:MAG: Ig-like domain-containing protein [Flavobacteriales bacterium]|nr:Ig-like domain-containing protein [Flavobacteriales bacterium]
MVKKINRFIGISLLLFVWSCAQVVAPTGGERDISPPEITGSKPENGTTLFNSTKIEIEFNEYVVLKKLKEQLIISPPLKYPLKTKIKGKSLELLIKDTLKSNTTYVFNFGNAIVDLNEGNPISGFQYVFSTGAVLDSLTLSGLVIDAFSLTVEEDFLVMLYPKFETDSVPSKELPSYVARTDKEGNFTVTNIKEGVYQLVGLKDKNNNYLYDRPDEKVVFLNELISVQANNESLRLYAFLKKDNKQFIEKQNLENAQLDLTFKLPLENLNFSLLDTTIEGFILDIEKLENKSTLWLKEISGRKLRIEISAENFIDTIKFKTDTIVASQNLQMLSTLEGTKNYFEPIELEFNRPIQFIETDSITIIDNDSNTVPFTITRDSISKRKMFLEIKFEKDKEYSVMILPHSFIDIYDTSTDTITASLIFNKLEDFGKLEIKLSNTISGAKLLQLTNPKGEKLREQLVSDSITTFNFIAPGNYRLKLIYDRNENGLWDTGDFYQKLQPEKVILFDDPINIRKNWDKEINWILP